MQRDTAKAITRFAAGWSTGAVVAMTIRYNVNPTTLFQKAEVAVGTLAIAGAVGEFVEDWVGRKFDEFDETIKIVKIQG